MPIDRPFGPRFPDSHTVKGRVDQVFDAYDHNRNGVINLEKPSGLIWDTADPPSIDGRRPNRELDERFKQGGYGFLCDRFQFNSFLPPTDKTHIKLFEAADTDKDKRVTKQELQAVIARYDDDKDGRLDQAEAARLDADFEEKTVTFASCGPVMF